MRDGFSACILCVLCVGFPLLRIDVKDQQRHSGTWSPCKIRHGAPEENSQDILGKAQVNIKLAQNL